MTDPIEALGIIAIVTMVASYALERRGAVFIAIFAAGCALAAVYAYLIEVLSVLSRRGHLGDHRLETLVRRTNGGTCGHDRLWLEIALSGYPELRPKLSVDLPFCVEMSV